MLQHGSSAMNVCGFSRAFSSKRRRNSRLSPQIVPSLEVEAVLRALRCGDRAGASRIDHDTRTRGENNRENADGLLSSGMPVVTGNAEHFGETRSTFLAY